MATPKFVQYAELDESLSRAKVFVEAEVAEVEASVTELEGKVEQQKTDLEQSISEAKTELQAKIDDKVSIKDLFPSSGGNTGGGTDGGTEGGGGGQGGEDGDGGGTGTPSTPTFTATLVTETTAATASYGQDEPDHLGQKLTVSVTKATLGNSTDPVTTVSTFNMDEVSGVKALKETVDAKFDEIEGKMQEQDPALESLIDLDDTGIVRRTGEDEFAIGKVNDTDVETGTALKAAVDAFTKKDGTVSVTGVKNGENDLISEAATKVTVGNTTDTLVLKAKADADDQARAGVYAYDPDGQERRLANIDEVKTIINTVIAGSSSYRGKFKFYAEDAVLANAKQAVEGKDAVTGDKALAFDTAAHTVSIGTYTTSWNWATAAAWNNGDWAWVEDLLTEEPAGKEYPSGRVIYDTPTTKFDILPDREGKPDQAGLTYNDNGAIALKMTKNTEEYGNTDVHATLNAGNLGFGGGKTIKEKIEDMEYTVATPDEVKGMLDRIFGPAPSEDDDEDDDDNG